ncbi:PREDICTED: uncharacterized protein LOC100639764 [Amphimedon queenslandica]|uniref:Uncharacterized protein n=2 Tax=Amphimedon queenslandica TaxID=400682 RepID=A0AAN0IMZ3_AMPQE|nr:PREDICTED: uncharacterized protein LOC100639764 [Amphimedon queenslandica]|eukprot:XP_011404799.1 PREDICTED: uncharacterized protein LOC100639764 [Amphimedon queenslandica]
MWWQMFVSSWNGISMLSGPMNSPADVEVFSDASGSWGGGAFCFPQWFAFKWPLALESTSIQVKELIPVVMAAALFGSSWKGKLVVSSVNNEAVAYILNKTHSKESHLMHLIRLLVFYAAHFDFWFRAEHIPEKRNSLADALSRDNINYFLSQAPHFHTQPVSVPPSLLPLVALDE